MCPAFMPLSAVSVVYLSCTLDRRLLSADTGGRSMGPTRSSTARLVGTVLTFIPSCATAGGPTRCVGGSAGTAGAWAGRAACQGLHHGGTAGPRVTGSACRRVHRCWKPYQNLDLGLVMPLLGSMISCIGHEVSRRTAGITVYLVFRAGNFISMDTEKFASYRRPASSG